MGVARSPASPTPTCLWSKEFYETGPSRGFVRGYTFQFGRGVGVVGAAEADIRGRGVVTPGQSAAVGSWRNCAFN